MAADLEFPLRDADASRINLSSVTTSIGTLAGYSRPSSLPDNNRVSPVELMHWT